MDGFKIHEPRLEKRPGHLLQRLIHPPVQLNLIIQRPEYMCNDALFREGREWKLERSSVVPASPRHLGALRTPNYRFEKEIGCHQVKEVAGVNARQGLYDPDVSRADAVKRWPHDLAEVWSQFSE
jgi:hypothetical protein